MQFNYIQKSKMYFVGALGLFFGLASCGTYQYAGYENDGVYGESNNIEYRAVATQDNSSTPKSNSGYYNNYFKEKSQELDYISQEDEVFTDIDSYEGSYDVENDTLIEYEPSYAGWGQNPSEVSINVYGGGYYGNYWWGRPYYSHLYWGYGYGNYWGYGYNNYWCPPYYYGSYYSGWYSPWYRPYGYYGYYGSPYYYRGHYYNNYYNRRGLAYNSGRRGHLNRSLNTSSRLNRRSSALSSRSNTYRPRRSVNYNRNNNTSVRPRTINRRTTTRSTRPNVNTRSSTRTRMRNNSSSVRNRSSSTRARSNTRSNYRSSSSRSSMRSSSPSRSSSRRSGNSGSSRRGKKM